LLRLTAQPLSGDEAWRRDLDLTSLQYLLQTIALSTTEPHPPIALRQQWAQLTGDSIFAVRLPAVPTA
jgi:hypothetical protein